VRLKVCVAARENVQRNEFQLFFEKENYIAKIAFVMASSMKSRKNGKQSAPTVWVSYLGLERNLSNQTSSSA
jgi:hypothetical protein